MKHAILIMMHKNPEQVVRLIRCFPKEQCVCFLHIDAKSPVSTEKMKKLIAQQHLSCVVLTDRISGVLTNWSLVEISLALLRSAKAYESEHSVHFDYYRLVSGQDYLIQPFTVYDRLLEQTYPMDYIGMEDIDQSKHVADKYARWRMPGPRQYIADAGLQGTIREKLLIGGAHVGEVLWTKWKGTPREAIEGYGWKPVGGPSWWSITDRFADYLLLDTKLHRDIQKIIRLTATPEESYIQMIHEASGLFPRQEGMYNLTIGKYNEQGHTIAWRASDYERLITSDCYFARKFDAETDSDILDLLDQYIGNS